MSPRQFRATFIAAVLALPAVAAAQEFRMLNPIHGPGMAMALPDGAVPVKDVVPVSRQEVERGVRRVMQSWNTPELAQKLAETFYDKTRLTDTIDAVVPRDAKLSVLGVQGVQTLSQHVVSDPSGLFDTYISRVSATVRTQVEWNDPRSGFQRRDGTNEIILRITQRVLK